MKFYPFGFEANEVAGSVEVLGGKGAGLLYLANEGVPVPPGFVIPTSVWAEYDQKPKTTMKAIAKALPAYLAKLEEHFGYMPLLSVRSGARVSCPGMMDTILNVGIDAETMPAWAQRLGPKCFADSFKRLVTMYSTVVSGLRKESLGSTLASALDEFKVQTGAEFPDAKAQLLGAIEAVFESWDNERAKEYRKMHGYDRAWGTAVTVQAMVFGNLNDQSGSGVLFTRNPDTGAKSVTGEWLMNAQGEDIVAGLRTPVRMDEMKDWNAAIHTQLIDTVLGLESKRKDVQDIEWTVQDGTLYLLQVRNAKRSATAAIRVAVDMATEGLIDAKTAIGRVTAKTLDLAQTASIDPKWTKEPAFTGISACSGVVTGKPVFTKEAAIECKVPCILVRQETTPDDIAGMNAAVGVVTMVGGLTSHAAVVARGMNRVCIVGVEQSLDAFKDIEVLSLDGATGRIWTEQVQTVGGSANGLVHEFNQLVCKTLGVVPVVFDAPAYDMPEALLYIGDKVLNPAKAALTVIASLKKVGKLYLDLMPSAEEQKYLSILSAHDHTGRLLKMLTGLLPESHELYSRLVLITDASTGFNRIAPGATDLKSLVLGGAEIILDGLDATDPAVAKVLAWKQAEGSTVLSIGTYIEGSKSFVSVAQALQVVGVS